MLIWARETAKLSLEDATRKLGIKNTDSSKAITKLSAYENGIKDPSTNLLLRMTKVYRRPLVTFYLDKPPLKGDYGQDFRTLTEDIEPREDFYVDTLIRNLKARQSILKEALIDEEEDARLAFIGSCNYSDGVQKLCDKIIDILDFDLEIYRSKRSIKQAFDYLRRKIEETGIFIILQGNLGSYHTNIKVSVFRGFVLSDDIAPFITINDNDAITAQSFTLLHELTHLLLGNTGLSAENSNNKIEKFCNEVASEFLLPQSEFQRYMLRSVDFESVVKEIEDYATKRKISSSQVAYRLYNRGDLSFEVWKKMSKDFKDLWEERKERKREKNRQKSGGPSYYTLKKYKLGSLVNLADRFVRSGSISTVKASILLNVKPLKIERIFEI